MDHSSALEHLQNDTEQLRIIAQEIFTREQDSTTLSKKMCLHSKTVLDFWGTTPMWQDLSTQERQALKPPSEITSTNWLKGLLRKEEISEFTSEAMSNYKELTLTLIKHGTINLTENKGRSSQSGASARKSEVPTKTYTITIKHKFDHPVGNLLHKVKSGDKKYKIEPLSQNVLLLVVDITDIVEALEKGLKYDLSTMGYISTICPN